MKTLKEITKALQGKKDQLKEKYPIKSIGIFGSFARNEQTPISDVDLVVEFNDKIGSRFIDLANELENYLGIKVDLVSKRGIKPKYFESIKKDIKYV